MQISNAKPGRLKSLLTLEEKRAALQRQIDQLQQELSKIQRQLFDGPGSAGAKASGRTTRQAKVSRGALKERIMAALQAAGSAGVGVTELASTLGTKSANLHAWFHSTAKKIPGITKISGGRYRLQTAGSSGAAVAAAPKEFDPLEAGRKLVQQMQKAEGGAWTGAELEQDFGLSSANLHKRRSEFRIIWWKDAKNQFHYPKWQFDQAGALMGGVQDVLQSFRSSDQWRVMRYFLTSWHQLYDQRPLDLLRRGEVDMVVAHAKAHAEENSW